jgi:filamentous hemagglutinin
MSGEGGHAPSPPPGRDTGAQGDDPCGEDARSQDTAGRPARGAELPESARELPNARDVLPNLEKAEIDERKFSEYSMNPGHPDNQGKAEGWWALGYDVDNRQARQEAARELRDLTLEELLANGKVAEVRDDSYGARPRVISGITGPNGRNATMVTCWLIEDRSGTAIPRLITTWVQPHRDKEAGQ